MTGAQSCQGGTDFRIRRFKLWLGRGIEIVSLWADPLEDISNPRTGGRNGAAAG